MSRFPIGDVGTPGFTVSTNPGSSSPGRVQGTRDAMQFYVTVEATANQPIASPPSTVTFQMRRPSINTTYQLTGDLVAGSSPPKYRAWWTVTGQRGKWFIEVETPHKSNTASFKINKRQQIVEVANSWEGAPRTSVPGGANCEDLVGAVYGHLGLSMNAATPTLAGESAPLTDSQAGSIILYHSQLIPTTPWQHVGINVGGNIVDQNCGPHPGNNGNTTVCKHSATAPVTCTH